MAEESRSSGRSTAEERKRQLLEVARRIIETEGVEALRPTRIAELAGCTRPLIYQYFPRREDFFIEITEDFYRVLEEASQAHGGRVISEAARGNPEPARGLADALWTYLDEKGPSALILRSTPEISADFKAYLARLRDSYEVRWRKGFLDLGMDATRADFMLELFATVMKVLGMQYLSGRIDRDAAAARYLQTIGALLRGTIVVEHTTG